MDQNPQRLVPDPIVPDGKTGPWPRCFDRYGILDAASAELEERLALSSAADQKILLDWHAGGRTGPEPESKLSALCFSGGGIRSAAFCLGVVQALAKQRVLQKFDYLSSVSGGGYISAWLTRLIDDNRGNLLTAESLLANTSPSDTQPEPGQVRNLRRYTNYLAPNPGFASPDTWAGLVLWLRNTFINTSVFLPLALFAAGIPVFCLNAVGWAAWFDPQNAYFWIFEALAGGAALLALFFAVRNTCVSLPSHDRPDPLTDDRQDGLPEEQRDLQFGLAAPAIWKKIAGLTLIWVFLVPLAVSPVLALHNTISVQNAFCPHALSCYPAPPLPSLAVTALNWPSLLHIRPWPPFGPPVPDAPPPPPWPAIFHWPMVVWFALLAWLVSMLGYISAAASVAYRYRHDPHQRRSHLKAFTKNFFPNWAVSSGISAGLLLIGAWLAYNQSALWVSLAGPLWVLMAELARSAAYVAFRTKGLNSELDREWLARLNGDKLRVVLFICLLGATAVWLPREILDFQGGPVAAIAAGIGLATGPAAAWLGKTASSAFSFGEKSEDMGKFLIKKYAVLIAAAVFGLTMFMLLGRADLIMAGWFSQSPLMPALGNAAQQDFGAAAIAVGVLALGFLGLAMVVDHAVNLNRFSMHAVYRNRLIRAFLGTARENTNRRPDRYTSFDPEDNIRLAATWRNRTVKKLLPIFNVSLNYTSGKDTSRAERKAEAFTISPLHCGSADLHRGSDPEKVYNGAYIRTERYAGGEKETGPRDKCRGITLGTAMAISGAAASPNMGYNSSPAAAFLMTLFNVRLGAWLPNPGCRVPNRTRMKRSGPRHAISTMLQELAGRSDDKGDYIYLSDGGHFDNLGLYEMLRRACPFITVIDASADPGYGYFDLGHTLDIAQIDFGVKVTFPAGLKTGKDARHAPVTLGDITYLHHPPGKLLYIKPCLPDDLPIQFAAYRQVKPQFPHESTLDQFFTESDFENYRGLGELLASRHDAKRAIRAGLSFAADRRKAFHF